MKDLKVYKKHDGQKTIVKVKNVTFNDGSFNLIAGLVQLKIANH